MLCCDGDDYEKHWFCVKCVREYAKYVHTCEKSLECMAHNCKKVISKGNGFLFGLQGDPEKNRIF